MSPLAFSALVFIATLLAALVGFQVQRLLPDRSTDETTAGDVKVVLGMLSMLTTVVLGFVTAEAKNSFDKAASIISDTAVRLVTIDRVLAGFGAEAAPIRVEIKRAATEWMARIKSPEGDVGWDLMSVRRGEQLEEIFGSIKKLQPASDAQSRDHDQAVELAAGILHDRWTLTTERAASTPTIFLMVVLAWLAVEFFIFGLFASPNAVVLAATFFACLTLASAMFLVLDLEGPMTGPMRISTRSLERAAAIMGQ
jgi:hypothetical protein